MKDPRSALDNQRLNVARDKRNALHALARGHGRWRMLQRLKNDTLCLRISAEAKGAESACHQHSAETCGGQRRTVIVSPQLAFSFDRSSHPLHTRVGRFANFPVIPSYASQLWLADPGLAYSDWPPLMAAISKIDDSIKHTYAKIADSNSKGIETKNKANGRGIERALNAFSATQTALPAVVSCMGIYQRSPIAAAL